MSVVCSSCKRETVCQSYVHPSEEKPYVILLQRRNLMSFVCSSCKRENLCQSYAPPAKDKTLCQSYVPPAKEKPYASRMFLIQRRNPIFRSYVPQTKITQTTFHQSLGLPNFSFVWLTINRQNGAWDGGYCSIS